MASTVPVEWSAPTGVWRLFTHRVEEDHGTAAFHRQFTVEQAMNEWMDADPHEWVESRLDTVREHLPHLRERVEHIFYSFSTAEDEPTTKVRERITPKVKAEFRRFVTENTDLGLGEALGRALWHSAQGGRVGRIGQKLEGIITVLEADEKEEDVNPNDLHWSEIDTEDLDGRYRSTKAIKICQYLDPDPGDIVDEEMIDRATKAVISGEETAPETLKDYHEAVPDRLGFAELRPDSGVYVHPADDRLDHAPQTDPDTRERLTEREFRELEDNERFERAVVDSIAYMGREDVEMPVSCKEIARAMYAKGFNSTIVYKYLSGVSKETDWAEKCGNSDFRIDLDALPERLRRLALGSSQQSAADTTPSVTDGGSTA